MNLFSHIRNNYGQDCVKELRQCESYERKLSRQRNHLVFSLRCKDEGIIPASLQISCPIKTKRAQEIILKAKKDLLRERIRITSQKIENFKNRIVSAKDNLLGKLTDKESEIVTSHLQSCRENEFIKTKQRH